MLFRRAIVKVLYRTMMMFDRKKDGDLKCNGSAIRWRRDRGASCFFTLFGSMLFGMMTYLLLKETVSFVYDQAPSFQQLVQRQYCEDFIDQALVSKQSIAPLPPPKLPVSSYVDYKPQDDPMVAFDKDGINSAKALNVERIFYNRVAKCGSRTVMRILEKLEHLNNFTIYKSQVFDKMKLQLEDQASFIDDVMKVPTPLLIDRHIHYLDFHAMGGPQPTYINVVRDPVDRAISTFYFKQNNLTSPEEAARLKIKTFEECVYKKKEGCTGRHVYMKMVYYFCGQDPRCWFDRSRSWTLQQAKQVVTSHYAVVGIVEDMDSFFYALEKRLPRFFRGAFALYGRHGAALKESYKTQGKVNPSEEVRKIMKKNMPEAYEFYYFVRQRFHNLLDQIMEENT